MNIIRIKSKFFERVIEVNDGPFIGSTAPMVDLGANIFKYLNVGKIKPEKMFTDAYVKEVYESENIRTATKQLRVILDAKFRRSC